MAQKINRFLLLMGAAALFLAVLWLVPHTPAPVYRAIQEGTGFLVVNMAHLLGVSASYSPSTHLFQVAGFNMLLAEECVALHYHAILTLAILLAPKQGWRRKAIALVCCNAALVFFNVLRLVFLGVFGQAYPELFEVVHDVLWQVAFAILTFLLCLAWIKSPKKNKATFSGVVLVSLAFSGVFALVLNIVKVQYLSAMVWLADKALLLARFESDWNTRWWAITKKSFVMVRLDAEKVLYVLPSQQYTVNLWQDTLNLALFWGFCVGGVLWLLKQGNMPPLKRTILGVGFGTVMLALLHLCTVVVLGWLLPLDLKMDLGGNFLWFMRGVSVILPFVFWWAVWKQQNQGLRTFAG